MSDDPVLDLLEREASSPVLAVDLDAVRSRALRRRNRVRGSIAALASIVMVSVGVLAGPPHWPGRTPTLGIEPVSGDGHALPGAVSAAFHPAGFPSRDPLSGLKRFWRKGCSMAGVAWVEHDPPVGDRVLLPDPDADGVPELPGPYSCTLDYGQADVAAARHEAAYLDAKVYDGGPWDGSMDTVTAALTANALADRYPPSDGDFHPGPRTAGELEEIAELHDRLAAAASAAGDTYSEAIHRDVAHRMRDHLSASTEAAQQGAISNVISGGPIIDALDVAERFARNGDLSGACEALARAAALVEGVIRPVDAYRMDARVRSVCFTEGADERLVEIGDEAAALRAELTSTGTVS